MATNSDPILRYLHACVVARVPCVLWGAPGSGKTSRVKLYARVREAHYERWILSRCEPIDLKPRIMFDGKVIVGDPPEYDRCKAAIRAGKLAIMFCDEANRTDKSTEGAALDIFDSAADQIDAATKAGIAIVVACNPPSRGQSARHLDSATANRFAHFDVDVTPEAWADAQINGWPDSAADYPVPDEATLAKAERRARALFSAFVRKLNGERRDENGKLVRKSLLDGEPDNTVAAGRAWSSARSLENARKLYAVAVASDFDHTDTRAVVAACVGEGVADEVLAFTLDAALPDPEDLLADPKAWKPDAGRMDRTIAILTALVGAVDADLTADRFKAAWTILNRTVDAGQLDAAMVGGDLIVRMYRRRVAADAGLAKKIPVPHTLMCERMARALV
jgi:MoxR-like ATPase